MEKNTVLQCWIFLLLLWRLGEINLCLEIGFSRIYVFISCFIFYVSILFFPEPEFSNECYFGSFSVAVHYYLDNSEYF